MSLPNPLDPGGRIGAVLFDLDGTLYSQAPLRSLMAMELLTLPLAGPFAAPKRWRALQAYRSAQDQLRERPVERSIAAEQLAIAAAAASLPPAEVERLVHEWMLVRPLKYLRFCRAAGVDRLLDFLARAGVRAGVLSDYPPAAKLRALGLDGRFHPVLCSTDPDVGALKPRPHGFLRACELWNLEPHNVLMVGDRVDVDAAGAAAAGMPCVIIGRNRRSGASASGYLVLPSLERLHGVLDEH